MIEIDQNSPRVLVNYTNDSNITTKLKLAFILFGMAISSMITSINISLEYYKSKVKYLIIV